MGRKIKFFFKSKIVFNIIIILIVISSFKNITAEKNIDDDINYYGFVIPLPQGEDTTNETFERSRIIQLINDLLREDIDIYQSREDFLAHVNSIDGKNVGNLFFLKGAFIIPFSGDNYKDIILTSIIYNYNQTPEINTKNQLNCKVYILVEELIGKYDKLVEPKIVQHFGESVRCSWPTYLEIADAGGFYTMEYFLNNEASRYLNNHDYNIFIWPYLPGQGTLSEQLFTIFNTEETNAIRSFVNNGGGFIGTCQGAFIASAGLIIPGVLNSVRLAYQSNLSRKFPGISLAISDTIMRIHYKLRFVLYQITIEIIKPNHPLFHGVNNTFFDVIQGPLFAWIGKNTEVLAIFKELKTLDGDSIDDKNLNKLLNGSSSWVNSKFGKGEVILFASHPDFINNINPLNNLGLKWNGDPYNGRKIIYNSFFYVTSEKNIKLNLFFYYEQSYINSIFEKTNNIQINETTNYHFSEIINDLNGLKNNLINLNDTIIQFNELYPSILEKTKRSPRAYKYYFYNHNYTSWLSYKFQNYIDDTISTLIELNKIIPMIIEYNESIIKKVETLKINLNKRLEKAEEIILDVLQILEKIENILQSNRINLLQEISLLTNNKNLLKIFEIELKYIPQIFFESQKILRNFWYNYEANIALKN